MAPHLNNDEFFSSLTGLLSKTSQNAHGSIYLTQKPLLDGVTNGQPSILIRASNGNTDAPHPKTRDGKITKDKSTKVKFSTIVAASDIEAFYTRYADVCKTGMTGLKKRDRSKRKAKGKGGAKATKA